MKPTKPPPSSEAFEDRVLSRMLAMKPDPKVAPPPQKKPAKKPPKK
jgi:hypothetical protein